MTSAQASVVLQHIRRQVGAHPPEQSPDGLLLQRFTVRGDEAAFADLVRRHGPMVLGVCRSVLRHEQDAEDAFQATFLILARRAASIRQPEAVAGWLFEVAQHVAVRAHAEAARRRGQERKALPLAPADPTLDMTLRDLQRVLHEELRRLPEKYRLPLVLCYLEGRSHEEAAGQLGWSKGAFRGLLDRGRERLRRRLAARGVTLSALLAAPAIVPRAAAEALVQSVRLAVVGGTASGVLSARASILAEGVIRSMWTSKLKVATAVLLAVGVVAGAGALARPPLAGKERPVASQQSEVRGQKPQPAAAGPAAADDKDSIAYAGRVLGPDGKLVVGAKLYLTRANYASRPTPSSECAMTGSDGRFQFTAPGEKYRGWATVVAAAAAKRGLGWVKVPAGGKRDGLTIRLVADDVPITGQVIDLEGRPVAGATLTVLQIHAAPGEDLGPWLEAVKVKKGRSWDLEQQYLSRSTMAPSPKVTTDAAGRFRLVGIGRNRLVRAQIDGPGIATQQLRILTRPGKPLEAMEFEGRPEFNDPRRLTTYYGASFRHVAAPSRPIVGVVRDKDTKKPLAGVSIRSLKLANHPVHYIDGQEIVWTTTDAQGRYRLTGMPKGKGNKITVVPPRDLPYMMVGAEVPDSPGLDAVAVDVALKRGVWIEGRITDKITGKPVKAGVRYLPLYSNPNRRDYPGVDGVLYHFGTVKEDGSYRLVGLPGPGMVAVYGQENHYLRVSQREDEYGIKGLSDEEYPLHIRGSNCGALTRVNPDKGADKVLRDVTLDPGWKLQGTVLGVDGKPLAGTRSFLLVGHWWDCEATRTAEFTAWFNPHERSEILFHHPEKGLVGVAQTPKENGGRVAVRLQPGATLTGRLVDEPGKPRVGVELALTFRPKGGGSWFDYPPEPIRTDRDGRFRIEALVPGYPYRLSDGIGEVPLGEALRWGQTTDLADVRMKPKPGKE